MKPIRLSKHASNYFEIRGFSDVEVFDAILSSDWIIGESGRYECRKNFEYKSIWNKKFYDIKQIRPIFVDEENEIVVITVYVYYFKEEKNENTL